MQNFRLWSKLINQEISSTQGYECSRTTRANEKQQTYFWCNKRYFSSNNLPFLVSKYLSAYICNTDPSYLPRSHWVLFWMHSPIQAEFYDSLGNPPVYYESAFGVFLQNNCKQCLFNNFPIQNRDSDSCGYHVFCFIYGWNVIIIPCCK